MKKGKVQTNEYSVNVLVETEDSSNTHYHHSDKEVNCRKLSDEEIKESYINNVGEPSLEDMKDKLKKISGYAISNCASEEHSHDDLFVYEKI